MCEGREEKANEREKERGKVRREQEGWEEKGNERCVMEKGRVRGAGGREERKGGGGRRNSRWKRAREKTAAKNTG